MIRVQRLHGSPQRTGALRCLNATGRAPHLMAEADCTCEILGRPSSRKSLPSKQRPQWGFSLIEMLVALVVLSLSLSALYQAATGATRNVRVAAQYTDAVMLAESMLAEHSYITEESYSASGQFNEFEWVVSSWPAPYDDGKSPEQQAVAPQALQYLQVVVSWPGRGQPRTFDLTTVVPLQEPLE